MARPFRPSTLNDIERDRRNPPGDHLLGQLAKALDLDEDYLYFLAGKFPSDVRSGSKNPKEVAAAFRAFRRTLGGGR